jgi:hypothetical protein
VASISYEQLNDPNALSRNAARQALTTAGILQIKDIPNFATARVAALRNLADCFSTDANPSMMAMSDGTVRKSVGASSSRGVGGAFQGSCGDAAADLRVAVDLGVRQLFRSLDEAAIDMKANATDAMFPYETYEELVEYGEHLEHLHTYYSAPKPTTTAVADASASSSSIDSLPQTVQFHTDGGMFIAMTTGLYKDAQPSSRSGLYLRTPSGSVAKAELADDALVVMIGEAGANWLGYRLSAPLKAVEHAMYADLSESTSMTGSAGKPQGSRSWLVIVYE